MQNSNCLRLNSWIFINSIAKKFWRFLTKKLRLENGIGAVLLPSSSFAQVFAKCRSRSGFLPNVAFAGFCLFSLPFFALNFVKFVCRRLFAKFFDLRSWLSVSLPLRSVGTPSPPSRESRFFKPRNNLEPCTDSLELCRRVWHRRKSEQRTFG